jgi:hypothetical protein
LLSLDEPCPRLAVLLHKLWVSAEVYEPLRNNHKVVSAVA